MGRPGQSVDEAAYQRALDVCALRADLAALPAGEETEIGERGINISGVHKVLMLRACVCAPVCSWHRMLCKCACCVCAPVCNWHRMLCNCACWVYWADYNGCCLPACRWPEEQGSPCKGLLCQCAPLPLSPYSFCRACYQHQLTPPAACPRVSLGAYMPKQGPWQAHCSFLTQDRCRGRCVPAGRSSGSCGCARRPAPLPAGACWS